MKAINFFLSSPPPGKTSENIFYETRHAVAVRVAINNKVSRFRRRGHN